MSDEPQSPNPDGQGQVGDAPWAQGTAPTTPASQDGPAQAPQGQDAGQATPGPAPTGEPSFHDYNDVTDPVLLARAKLMQADYTRKTQALARERQKVEAYDAFMSDPIGQMQRLAAQYGMTLSRAQAAQQLQQQGQAQNQQWEPQTWGEVITKVKEEARQEIMQALSPYFGQVQQMQAKTIEQQLNSIDPNWRQYEGDMSQLLQQHPTLVNNVSLLYRMAVPPEALEAKAIQQALNRFEKKAEHAKVTPQGSAPRSKPAPPQVKSFEDAVNAAKQQITSGEV